MKNYNIVIKLLFAIFLFNASCTEFLEEKPKNQIAVSQYFSSEEDAYSIVNSIYRIGVPTYFIGDFAGSNMMLGGYMSGYFDNERRGERPGPQEAIDLSINPDNLSDYLSSWWSQCYQAISRANTAIKYLPLIEDLSTNKVNSLIAEARFFRALNYFYLVKNFGDVPIVVEPYENLDDLFVARNQVSAVYEQIVKDLKWGLENSDLPFTPLHLNGFRITKGAIATLLADVYLQMGGYPMQQEQNYGLAADAAKLVIESQGYELMDHGNLTSETAYNKLRNSDHELEYIYNIEYNSDLAPNSNPQFSYPANNRPPIVKYGNTYVAYKPSIDYLNMYEADDLRIKNQQYFFNEIEVDNVKYTFNFSAPYIWHDDNALFNTGRGNIDIKVYTYSEVLLIAAEALAKSSGVSDEAVNYLLAVRSRAFPEIPVATLRQNLQSLSKDAFISEVYKERLRELPFSFKIWSDIQRTRLYPKYDAAEKVRFVDVVGQSNGWGKTYQAHHLLFPIPTKEIQSNPSLIQNPGY